MTRRRNVLQGWSWAGSGATTEKNDGCDASRPGGQHVGHWNDFDDEGRQKQGVESEQRNDGEHGYDINDLVEGPPSQRTDENLDPVGRQRDAEGQRDSPAADLGFIGKACHRSYWTVTVPGFP